MSHSLGVGGRRWQIEERRQSHCSSGAPKRSEERYSSTFCLYFNLTLQFNYFCFIMSLICWNSSPCICCKLTDKHTLRMTLCVCLMRHLIKNEAPLGLAVLVGAGLIHLLSSDRRTTRTFQSHLHGHTPGLGELQDHAVVEGGVATTSAMLCPS